VPDVTREGDLAFVGAAITPTGGVAEQAQTKATNQPRIVHPKSRLKTNIAPAL
jgi:hypothetical protein